MCIRDRGRTGSENIDNIAIVSQLLTAPDGSVQKAPDNIANLVIEYKKIGQHVDNVYSGKTTLGSCFTDDTTKTGFPLLAAAGAFNKRAAQANFALLGLDELTKPDDKQSPPEKGYPLLEAAGNFSIPAAILNFVLLVSDDWEERGKKNLADRNVNSITDHVYADLKNIPLNDATAIRENLSLIHI